MPPHEFPAADHRCAPRPDRRRARQVAARIARAEAEGIGIGQSGHSWVLGFVELSLGDAACGARRT